MRRFTPHTARHGASRAHVSETPAGSRQGGEPQRPGSSPVSLVLYLARGLAVMALVGVVVLGAAVVLP